MNIILASASPRRKEILERFVKNLKIIKSDTEEIILEDELPNSVVMRLAFEKCMDVATSHPDSIVIGADTVVALDNTILGKPKDESEALQMIESLSGTTHKVITGISLLHLASNKKVIDYVTSEVTFKKLSQEDIKGYIETKESLDKAGAYGIQGYGSLLVEEIKGDYFNIVGLPISRLGELFKEHFNINLFYGG